MAASLAYAASRPFEALGLEPGRYICLTAPLHGRATGIDVVGETRDLAPEGGEVEFEQGADPAD